MQNEGIVEELQELRKAVDGHDNKLTFYLENVDLDEFRAVINYLFEINMSMAVIKEAIDEKRN